jgi:hypothetical protein
MEFAEILLKCVWVTAYMLSKFSKNSKIFLMVKYDNMFVDIIFLFLNSKKT